MLHFLPAPGKLLALTVHFHVSRLSREVETTTFDWISALDTNFERELFTGLTEVAISVSITLLDDQTLYPFTSTEQIADFIKSKLPKLVTNRVLVQAQVTVLRVSTQFEALLPSQSASEEASQPTGSIEDVMSILHDGIRPGRGSYII
ncbi:hypothetical protein K466DRAFT_587019 [Polyporus arcularius HHB13444]|uniref:Uncharacterized protein n=1 Tax=Polyporus arcularius HHB13444 TaxID=1314778 RepID=A0A5C3PAI6_9APHY|nr:hypothetical protein K466DRAFT_587019 [Polyporus arcularius HHB13444]